MCMNVKPMLLYSSTIQCYKKYFFLNDGFNFMVHDKSCKTLDVQHFGDPKIFLEDCNVYAYYGLEGCVLHKGSMKTDRLQIYFPSDKGKRLKIFTLCLLIVFRRECFPFQIPTV